MFLQAIPNRKNIRKLTTFICTIKSCSYLCGKDLENKEKARLKKHTKHPSWLRIYALKLSAGIYIVTGGAIKLTATMQEREHTLAELHKMELVRQFLLNENIVDDAGFIDYLSET